MVGWPQAPVSSDAVQVVLPWRQSGQLQMGTSVLNALEVGENGEGRADSCLEGLTKGMKWLQRS